MNSQLNHLYWSEAAPIIRRVAMGLLGFVISTSILISLIPSKPVKPIKPIQATVTKV